jgi:hypothetical protein
MKILVLCSNYPDLNGHTSGMFFHVRNQYYKKNSANVDVINFSARENYTKDGINVYTLRYSIENSEFGDYDILICHAPHIRHHYKFLRRYHLSFKNIVFVFHGNEVFKTRKILVKQYNYINDISLRAKFIRDIKDNIKLYLWKRIFLKLSYKSQFVFVSNWMREQFYNFIKIDKAILNNREYVIYNSVGQAFERNEYNKNKDKKFDFITIRNNLDDAKYGIEIVNNLAKSNPSYKFLIIGRGDFFKYCDKSPNIILIEKELSHETILNYLDESRFGLMPTLWDSQGLMTCEFVTFGIPTITSDIEICHEVLGEFSNVEYIDNDNSNIDLAVVINKLKNKVNNTPRNVKFFALNTTDKELQLFNKIVYEKNRK